MESPGTVEVHLVIPTVPDGGDYFVRFDTERVSIGFAFAVVPRPSSTPKTAAPGQTVILNLRGTAAHDEVLIRWKNGSSFVAATASSGLGGHRLVRKSPNVAKATSIAVFVWNLA